MDSVIRNFRHPVAIYYNRDGSLAFIRFMCFQCTVKSDYEYTWRYSGKNVKDLIQCDTLYYAELTRLPLVTLPDITNPALFSYVDIPAQQYYAKPQYFMSSSWNTGSLYNISSISKLYTDGELISQSFQVLGCFEPVRDYQRKTNISYRSECSRSGEPRLIIFDHTLKCSYIALSTLMKLKGHITIGNINLETGTVPERYSLYCPIALENVNSVRACDSLGVYSSGIQENTKTQVNELQIGNDYENEILPVPENVRLLAVEQRAGNAKIRGISCPSSMYSCTVNAARLETFVAPKSCAVFSLNANLTYTKQTFPEVMKPIASYNTTSFSAWGIKDISHNFTGYQKLKNVRVQTCSFISDTDELVLPVASGMTSYRNITLAPNIKTIRLFKNVSLSDVLPKEVELDIEGLDRDITIIVDCDINSLTITGCTSDIEACLTVTGKGRVRRGAIYNSNKIEIQNNWGTLDVGSGGSIIKHRELISIKGCVKILTLQSYKENNWNWRSYSSEAVLKLNNEKCYARDVMISLLPAHVADVYCKTGLQFISILKKKPNFDVNLKRG